MSLSRVCLVFLVVSDSIAEATDWTKAPEGLAAGVAMGVAKGPRQTDGDAPWPTYKTNQEEKRFHEGSQASRDQRQASNRRPRPCCGSVTPQEESVPTGEFTRVTSEPSVKIEDVPSKASAPPSAVTDLRVTSLTFQGDGRYSLGLAWTAPGGFFTEGAASDYVFRLSDDRRVLTQSGFDEAAACTLLHTEWEALESVLRRFGTPVALNATFSEELACDLVYFVALKAVNDRGTFGPVSNLAPFNTTLLRLSALFDAGVSSLKSLAEEVANRTRREKAIKKNRNRRRCNKMKKELLKIRKNLIEVQKTFQNRKRHKERNKKRKK